MKSLKKIITFIIIVTVTISCAFNKIDKKIDSFYTTKNFGQFSVIPLVKPIKLWRDDQSKEWGIDRLKYDLKRSVNINNQKKIGVDKSFIYGKLPKHKQNLNDYTKEDYVYFYKYGGVSISKTILNSKDEIRIYPIDSTSKTFILPERWFVINVADSITEAFFSKKRYDEYLKQKGISGEMYEINKYHKQYKETGILPWFPDSIKVKLKK
jgi:hypothetical protein